MEFVEFVELVCHGEGNRGYAAGRETRLSMAAGFDVRYCGVLGRPEAGRT